jgi:hypothetical protein
MRRVATLRFNVSNGRYATGERRNRLGTGLERPVYRQSPLCGGTPGIA